MKAGPRRLSSTTGRQDADYLSDSELQISLQANDEALLPFRREPTAASTAASNRVGQGPALLPGDLLASRFRILRYIARGGMGEVYEAEDLELAVRVALKTVLLSGADAPGALAQLKQEVQTARQVSHPNVCRIFDIACHPSATPGDRGTWFVTMELLEGRSLAQEIQQLSARGAKLSEDASRPLIAQLAAGLGAIHDAGVIHGDFKSQNVLLVDRADGSVRAVITDFGLAVQAASTDKASGSGTSLYMAPEQVERGKLSRQTDIYSLGVVIYEMVTGNWPFFASTPEATARKRLSEKPVPPTRYTPELDPVWTRTIMRCLEREPAARFPRALDVASALRRRSFYEARWFQAVAAVLLLAAITALSAWFLHLGPFRVASSIAVAGWKNVAGDAATDWVGTELSERLTGLLAENKKLAVIPQVQVATARLESALGRSADLSAEDLAPLRTALSGSSLVVGEYSVHEGRVQVRGELEDPSGHVRLRFEESETSGDIGALAAKIADRLTPMLKLPAISPEQVAELRQIYPADPQVRALYFNALDKLRSFRVVEARDLLLQAISVDPKNVAVHLALADAWAQLRFDIKAREQADQAAQLANVQGLLPEFIAATDARQAELYGHWSEAAVKYGQLRRFYPKRLEYLLKYTAALVKAGRAKDALARLDLLLPSDREPLGVPALQMLRANAYESLGDFQQQLKAAQLSLAAATSKGERLRQAQAQKAICWAQGKLGNADAALDACTLAQTIFTAFGDSINATVVLNQIAVLRNDRSDYEGAAAAFRQIISIVGTAGSQIDLAGALLNLAHAQINLGDSKSAEANLRRSLTVGQAVEDTGDEARARILLASVLTSTNRSVEASQQLEQALATSRALGDGDLEAYALSNLASQALDGGNLEKAEALYRQALALRQTMQETGPVAANYLSLSEVERRQGHPDEAKKDCMIALPAFESLGQKGDAAATRIELGLLAEDRGNYADALSLARAAGAEFEREHDKESLSEALVLAARSAIESGDTAGAAHSVEQAKQLALTDPQLTEPIEVADALTQAATGHRDQALAALLQVEQRARAGARIENALDAKWMWLRLKYPAAASSEEARGAITAFRDEAQKAGFAQLAQRAPTPVGEHVLHS